MDYFLISTLKKWLTSQWGYVLISSLCVVIIALSTHRPNSSNTIDKPIDQAVVGQRLLCRVKRVIDGDSLLTICAQQTHRLRLMHIDAPEVKQLWGEKATSVLRELAGQQVIVEFHGQDIYQRDLAVIYPSNMEAEAIAINLTLVKQGMARVYSRYQPPDNYRVAMKTAKANKLGIWQQQGLHQDPMRYRRLMR